MTTEDWETVLAAVCMGMAMLALLFSQRNRVRTYPQCHVCKQGHHFAEMTDEPRHGGQPPQQICARCLDRRNEAMAFERYDLLNVMGEEAA